MRCGITSKKTAETLDMEAMDSSTGQLLNWECGNRDEATLRNLVGRLEKCDVEFYCTDKWQ